MATDLADYSQAVQVLGGSVSITGTATVQITGTPTVSISGTPTVNVGNTPSVTISSGSVTATISGTPSINIQSQSVTVNVNQPQTALANLSFPAGIRSTQTSAAVPAGTHSLALENSGVARLNNVVVAGHTTGVVYWPLPFTRNLFAATPTFDLTQTENVVVPIDSTQDTTFDVTATNTSGVSAVALRVTAILDTQTVYVQNNPGAPVYVAGLHGFNPGALYAVETVPAAYDVTGTSAPAGGSQATVTLAASASGLHYTANTLSASSGQGANTAQQADTTLQDGVTALMTLTLFLLAGVGNNVAWIETRLAYKGTNNTAMTWGFGAGTTSVTQRVNIGAYLS